MKFENNPKRYPIFRGIEKIPAVISGGDYATVLALTTRHVAKVPVEPSYDLSGEYANHLEVYHADIPCPKPIGIFRFFPAGYGGEFGIGLIMEKLRGITGDKTRGKTRIRVERELESKLARCKELGFEPFDEGLHNCIWDSRKEKLYLVDFNGWITPANSVKRPK